MWPEGSRVRLSRSNGWKGPFLLSSGPRFTHKLESHIKSQFWQFLHKSCTRYSTNPVMLYSGSFACFDYSKGKERDCARDVVQDASRSHPSIAQLLFPWQCSSVVERRTAVVPATHSEWRKTHLLMYFYNSPPAVGGDGSVASLRTCRGQLGQLTKLTHTHKTLPVQVKRWWLVSSGRQDQRAVHTAKISWNKAKTTDWRNDGKLENRSRKRSYDKKTAQSTKTIKKPETCRTASWTGDPKNWLQLQYVQLRFNLTFTALCTFPSWPFFPSATGQSWRSRMSRMHDKKKWSTEKYRR